MQTQYDVKWCGFDTSQNTWENSTNLYCKEQIDAFEKEQETGQTKVEGLERDAIGNQNKEESDSLIESILNKKMVDEVVSFTNILSNLPMSFDFD